MRAVAVREWCGRDRMELLKLEPPPVAPDGVLVRVRAAGVNPVDALRELGAEPLDYGRDDVARRARDLLADSGADAAFDLFGADTRELAFSVLRQGGRLVSIARPPPEPRAGYEVHYIYVRPSGYDLGEHLTPLVAAALSI